VPKVLRAPWFLALPLAFLALWHFAVAEHWVVEGIIPSPAQVVESWYAWIFGSPTRRGGSCKASGSPCCWRFRSA